MAAAAYPRLILRLATRVVIRFEVDEFLNGFVAVRIDLEVEGIIFVDGTKSRRKSSSSPSPSHPTTGFQECRY